jgi:hypothetical protein
LAQAVVVPGCGLLRRPAASPTVRLDSRGGTPPSGVDHIGVRTGQDGFGHAAGKLRKAIHLNVERLGNVGTLHHLAGVTPPAQLAGAFRSVPVAALMTFAADADGAASKPQSPIRAQTIKCLPSFSQHINTDLAIPTLETKIERISSGSRPAFG